METNELNELYFKDCFSQSEGKTNLEINHLTANCITSPSNAFNLDNEGNLTVKTIHTIEGNEAEINYASIFDKVYPVGAIYMSVSATNPTNLFGGTWEQIMDRFLLASGNSYGAGTTGGEANHTLTINEIPAHNHTTTSDGAHYHTGRYRNGYTLGGNNYLLRRISSEDNYTGDAQVTYSGGGHGHNISNTGGNGAHNNMPPYLAVYVWKRVS